MRPLLGYYDALPFCQNLLFGDDSPLPFLQSVQPCALRPLLGYYDALPFHQDALPFRQLRHHARQLIHHTRQLRHCIRQPQQAFGEQALRIGLQVVNDDLRDSRAVNGFNLRSHSLPTWRAMGAASLDNYTLPASFSGVLVKFGAIPVAVLPAGDDVIQRFPPFDGVGGGLREKL